MNEHMNERKKEKRAMLTREELMRERQETKQKKEYTQNMHNTTKLHGFLSTN